MWEFFIKNSKFAYLFLVALLGVGIFSIMAIPKESSPEVVIPIGVITTVLPGAPAADIESLVTNEIERGLTSLENVKKITSTSREGVSSVVVEFDANADLDSSILDLKDQVDRIKVDLPEDASDPSVSEVNFVDQPIMSISLSGELTDYEFTELAENIELEIEALQGVSRVEIRGVREREVTIIVNQESLLRFNLSLNEVISGIRNANITFPIGQIENDGVSYNVAFEGKIKNTSEIGGIPIANISGQPIFLRDVATIDDGLTSSKFISRLSLDGKPSESSILLNVFKLSGGDITSIAATVNDRIDELKSVGNILHDITSVTILDAGADINKDLTRLSSSGFQTIILVVVLLVLTIGWREALLAGLSIPLSFLFGFIGLYFSGNTINFLSLFALILGIGILVDSAIVIVEGINRRMKDYSDSSKYDAAVHTIREFSAPLISGTLTTVAMFAGLFIVSGVIGQFIFSIPFTLIFLLLASLFVALAILPLIASVFLQKRNSTEFEQKQEEFTHMLEEWYRGRLRPYLYSNEKQNSFLSLLISALVFSIALPINVFIGVIAAPLVYFISLSLYRQQQKKSWSDLKRKVIWVPTAIASIGISFLIANTIFPTINLVQVIFFDQSDVNFIIIELEKPEGTTKEVTDFSVRRIEEYLYHEDEIESFSTTVGSGNEFGSGGTGEKFANIFITLKDSRKRTSSEIVEDLRLALKPLKDLKITVNQPSDGPPTGAAIVIKFLGDDLNEITELANKSAEILNDIPEIVNIESSTNNNNTEFVLDFDKDKAAIFGLTPFIVSELARTALYGTEVTSLTTLNDDIKIFVRLNLDNKPAPNVENTNIATIDDLGNILIPTSNGSIPLSSLVTISLRESSSIINHEDANRVVSVSADVSDGSNARELQMQAMQKIVSELEIPSDVIVGTGGGETEESNKAFIEMFLALVVGITLMVGILTLQFNSYLHMRYVLSILPYSLIGIMFGLTITQNSLSFPSMMGFIALSGIVVNNSILLIDMMNQIRRKFPSKDIKVVVLEAAGNRLRPILLTTITTVIGMIPLTYAGDLWAPLAYAVMFGLVFSVIITLILIPIIYSKNPGEIGN